MYRDVRMAEKCSCIFCTSAILGGRRERIWTPVVSDLCTGTKQMDLRVLRETMDKVRPNVEKVVRAISGCECVWIFVVGDAIKINYGLQI